MMFFLTTASIILIFGTLALFVLLMDITVLGSITLMKCVYYVSAIAMAIYANLYFYKIEYHKRLLCFLAWFLLNGAPVLVNYFFRSDEVYSEYAVITEQTIQKSRKENRLLFSNDRECKYVDDTIFEKFNKGDSIKIHLQKGALGMPIIVGYELSLYDQGIEYLLNTENWEFSEAGEYFEQSWIKEKNPEALRMLGVLYHIKAKSSKNLDFDFFSDYNYWKAYQKYQEAYNAGSKNAEEEIQKLEEETDIERLKEKEHIFRLHESLLRK